MRCAIATAALLQFGRLLAVELPPQWPSTTSVTLKGIILALEIHPESPLFRQLLWQGLVDCLAHVFRQDWHELECAVGGNVSNDSP